MNNFNLNIDIRNKIDSIIRSCNIKDYIFDIEFDNDKLIYKVTINYMNKDIEVFITNDIMTSLLDSHRLDELTKDIFQNEINKSIYPDKVFPEKITDFSMISFELNGD